MSSPIADLSKDLGTNADLLKCYFPRAGYGLEEAMSIKQELELKDDSIVTWSKKWEITQMRPYEKQCA